MKAITVWQPWASLLASGRKRYETRSWATTYRGPIAIHAAKRPVRRTIDALAADRGDGWTTLDYFESLLMRPGAAGKVVLQRSGKVVSCDFEGPRDELTGFGYISHFSTCPQARGFRRKR